MTYHLRTNKKNFLPSIRNGKNKCLAKLFWKEICNYSLLKNRKYKDRYCYNKAGMYLNLVHQATQEMPHGEMQIQALNSSPSC